MKSILKRKDLTGYWFVLPFVIGFLVFGLYPIINTFRLSFTDYTIMGGGGDFNNFVNYQRLFTNPLFWKAIGNTWLIWMCNFIPQIGIATLLAIWFTSARLKLKAVGVWRAIFFLPNLLMPAVVASLFFSLFSYYGPVNQFMVSNGFQEEAVHYLQEIGTTRGLVIFIQWWMWFGQTVIIVMAGMTSIPVHLYEAAMVDGANTMQMFWRITLPLLKPILIYVFVTSLVGGMQMFDIPYLLTDGEGAPAHSIMTNIVFMYMKFNSSKGHIGDSSTVGVVVFIMTSIVALGIFYALRERDRLEPKKSTRKLSFKKSGGR